MKIIKKIKEASMSKNKKDKKNLAKKIDKKILKALKERYLKAKKEKQEAKSAYKLAKSFFEKNNPPKKSKAKKSKKKKNKSKGEKLLVSKSTTTTKPASNAVVTSLSDLPPTPSKISQKLPKPLRIKKVKPTSKKTSPKATPKKTVATPKPTPAKKPVVKNPTVKKTVAKPKPVAKTTRKVTRKAVPKKSPAPKISEKQMGDLKVVEGIGPAIERLLKSKDIKTLAVLSKTRIGVFRQILEEAGSRYRFHKPDTWARQARMAAAGKWKELDAFQKTLDGGKKK